MDGVDRHQSVVVVGEIVQLFEVVSLLFEDSLVHVEEFDTPDDSSLLHIRVQIAETQVNRLLHVFKYAFKLERAERSQRQPPNLVVCSLHVHEERVDSQNC